VSRAPERILVGVTGASGAVYAERLIEVLLPAVERIYLIFTDAGRQVVRHELRRREESFSLVRAEAGELATDEERQVIRLCRNDDLFAPIASGSSVPTQMILLPCSMGTVARINQGISGNLLERAADVCLKQGRKIVLCPRETPFSLVHLRNLTSLAEMGVRIVPAMPAFYQHPKTIEDLVDFMVGRALEMLDLPHALYSAWNARMR
jgi:4-hydroxy-3-polyprenylbenzoate decarboxylase